MAIYYKFKSAKDYDSIAMDGPFIPVGSLKDKIFESKHLGNGKDFDLVVTNAQTNEEYLDEAMLIPKNTSVLIRRVPGRPRMPIVTGQELKLCNKVEDSQPDKSNYSIADSSALKYTEDEWDEFGNDLYSVPEVLAAQSSTPLPNAVFPNDTTDEESKIQALIDTPALDWQRQSADGFGIGGRGYGRGMGGRMGGRGFGRPGMERKTPPQGYVCHRCNVPGHLIQNCPTNGDPLYDVKRVKPPTGIPKSMLMANPDGSYALPSGAVAVLKPNEHAFEKEMEGLPSTRSVGELPPELRCPLCKEVMKDAVLTSKCCFKSFCDKCIRDHIISKSTCVCGATDVLADDLLPNKTLRDTISRIMEAGNSSADIAGSAVQVQDMESARCLPPKIPSPATSAASKGGQKTPPTTSASYKGEQKALPYNNNALIVKVETETAEATSAAQPHVERTRPAKPVDVCEATHESVSMKEATSQRSAQVPEEEVQQQLAAVDQGKKKKKKKASLPGAETQWRPGLDLAPDYMMHMGPSPFNPYWNGVQRGLNGFMGGYGGPMPGGPMPGGPMPPFMGYGMGGGPLDMPFGGMMHPDPFLSQGFGYPGIPPHRDLAELGMGMGMNMPRPIMSREEFEARKADLRRKRENDRRGESGHFPRDRESVREANSSKMNVSPMKPKSRPVPRSGSPDHRHQHRHRPERFSAERQPPPHPSKRMYNDRDGCREHSHDPHDHEGSRDRSHDHDRHRKRDKSHDRDRNWDHEHERKKSRNRERDHKHGHEKSQDLDLDLDHDREHKRERDRDHSHRHLRSEKASVDAEAAQEQTSGSEADKKQSKSSVFSRISFPEEEAARKKHKVSSSTSAGGSSSVHNHGRKEVGVTAEYESSDEDRHFKRRPSRYEPSPPPQPAADAHLIDQPRHSKRSKHRT